MADKLSTGQVARLIAGVAARDGSTHVVQASLVMADEEEVVCGDVLDAVRAEGDAWAERVCEAIRDHAQGMGAGTWKYAIRVLAGERAVSSTWARLVVRRSDADDEDAGLDGSVSSYVQQLQRSLETAGKQNVELQRMMMANFESQSKLMREMFERQASLERERADLVAASLADAVEGQKRASEDDVMMQLMKLVGPSIGEKIAEKFAPLILGVAVDEDEGTKVQ